MSHTLDPNANTGEAAALGGRVEHCPPALPPNPPVAGKWIRVVLRLSAAPFLVAGVSVFIISLQMPKRYDASVIIDVPDPRAASKSAEQLKDEFFKSPAFGLAAC